MMCGKSLNRDVFYEKTCKFKFTEVAFAEEVTNHTEPTMETGLIQYVNQ